MDARPPICDAAEAGDLAAVAAILDADPGQVHAVSASASTGPFTPLHLAAWQDHLDLARRLLDRGADPNARGEFGMTPLHLAIKHRNGDAAELLIDRGADVEAADDSRTRPLHYCMAGFDPDDRVIARLEAAGARVDLGIALAFGRLGAAWDRFRAGEPRDGDPDAEHLLAQATSGMVRCVSAALDAAGDDSHLDPAVRVPATARVVDAWLPLLDALIARPVPVTRTALAAFRNAACLWDSRPAERLLAAGVLAPFADRLGDRRFRGGLYLHVRMVNESNPVRPAIEAALRAVGVELDGAGPHGG